MMRVCNGKPPRDTQASSSDSQRYLSIDQLRKQLSVIHEYEEGPAQRQYTFDAVFTNCHDFQTDICTSILTSNDLIQRVISGNDACIFAYGQSEQEKSNTIFGTDRSNQSIGVAPLSILYIFKLLEQRGSNFKIEISSMEIIGEEEVCFDLIRNARIALDLRRVMLMESAERFECSNLQQALGYMDIALNSRTCKFK
jgi:hypothetical protein